MHGSAVQFSKRSEYALRALIRMAARPQGTIHSLGEIARSEGISQKFLEQIFLQLRKAGLLESRRGARGGYVLLQPAGAITVEKVLEVIEGTDVPAPAKPGDSDAATVLARYHAEVDSLVRDRHAATTVADLLALRESAPVLNFEI